MQLQRFDDPAAFYERAGDFLRAQEAEHNLMHGILYHLLNNTGRYTEPPYLAVFEDGGAVQCVAMRTPPHGILLGDGCTPAAVALLVADLHALYEVLPGVNGPKASSAAFAAAWTAHSGQPHTLFMQQRIYQAKRVIMPQSPSGGARLANWDDTEFLIEAIIDFNREAVHEDFREKAVKWVDDRLTDPSSCLLLWEDGGAPVSLAGAGNPTPRGIRVGPVYTPPGARRRGYGRAVTAVLTQMMLDQGRDFCFLYTDLGNPTSNDIYQQIGYVPVMDVDLYQFRQAGG